MQVGGAQPHGFRAAVRFGPTSRHPTTATRPTPGLTRKPPSATLGNQVVAPSGSQLRPSCFLLDNTSCHEVLNRTAARPCIPPTRCINSDRSRPSSRALATRRAPETKPPPSLHRQINTVDLISGWPIESLHQHTAMYPYKLPSSSPTTTATAVCLPARRLPSSTPRCRRRPSCDM